MKESVYSMKITGKQKIKIKRLLRSIKKKTRHANADMTIMGLELLSNEEQLKQRIDRIWSECFDSGLFGVEQMQFISSQIAETKTFLTSKEQK